MLHHTWYEEMGTAGMPPVSHQCAKSASMDAIDIVSARSDGVRDTPAQSLNGTHNPVTDILRFVHCDPETGHYTNTSAYAQQSCTPENGFETGEGYYNNYNNLMSYGDRTCLRTLTPGQGARARCAIKCVCAERWQGRVVCVLHTRGSSHLCTRAMQGCMGRGNRGLWSVCLGGEAHQDLAVFVMLCAC
jgi:hypothetical protein